MGDVGPGLEPVVSNPEIMIAVSVSEWYPGVFYGIQMPAVLISCLVSKGGSMCWIPSVWH